MNQHTGLAVLAAAFLLLPVAASADPYKHDRGWDKRHHARDFEESYWDGHCKVERKLHKNGDYKEKRTCKGQPAYYVAAPVYVPPVRHPHPVYVAAPQPGVVIQGTVRMR